MAIFIEFDGELGLFFDLSKSDSAIYANPGFLNVKEYKAPFDVALKKRFWGAKILNLSVPEGNRILKLVFILFQLWCVRKFRLSLLVNGFHLFFITSCYKVL